LERSVALLRDMPLQCLDLPAKIALGLGILVVVAGVVTVKRVLANKEIVEVEMHTIVRKDLASIIQASGKIRPKTMVEVSAAVSGKVLEVAVKEGDAVKKGQLLLRIDPKPFQTQVQQLEAAIESARATVDQMQANVRQSRQDRERLERLYGQQLISLSDLQKARTFDDVEQARARGAEQELIRLGANLSEASHELTKVDVLSDIDGTVVQLNIEAGENAFVGAFNNPATVLVSIADLTVIEAEVEVDETEAVQARPGQTADIEVDAHPGWVFRGRVSEVGHSPLRLQTGGEREGTAFKVKISVLDAISEVRPGLTCSAKIKTAERSNAIALPIQALTLRKPDESDGTKGEGAKDDSAKTESVRSEIVNAAGPKADGPKADVLKSDDPGSDGSTAERSKDGPASSASPGSHEGAVSLGAEPMADSHSASLPEDGPSHRAKSEESARGGATGSGPIKKQNEKGKVEGAFVVTDGVAKFRRVTIGLTGEKEFEVLSGLSAGDVILTGPFKALRTLKSGDHVKSMKKKEKKPGEEQDEDAQETKNGTTGA
jgi:HlyD family secretion protein